MVTEASSLGTVAVPSAVQAKCVYSAHFGLDGPPFEGGSTLTALFMSQPLREALAALKRDPARANSGFTLLVGAPGTGKTALIKALLARRPELQGSGERAVVIIDEAEELTDGKLEDLRLLSKVDVKGEKRLHFILVGRPQLLARLRTPALRNIYRSIGACVTLKPLKFGEAKSYVDYRLQQHGSSAQKIFNRRALRCLIAESAGIPARINMLCNSAMLAAYSRGDSAVSLADAQAAVAECRDSNGSSRTSLGRLVPAGLRPCLTTRSATAVAGAGLAAAAAGLLLGLAGGSMGSSRQPVERAAPVGVAPRVSASREASATWYAAKLSNEVVGGTGAMPPRLDPTVARQHLPPNPGVQPLVTSGVRSTSFSIGRGDTLKGQAHDNSGLKVAPEQTSSANAQASEIKRASAHDTPVLAAAGRRFPRRHHIERGKVPPPMAARDDDEALADTKPGQPLDKRNGATGEAHVLSLDPNWWLVPSR